jgi:hypothetical protein
MTQLVKQGPPQQQRLINRAFTISCGSFQRDRDRPMSQSCRWGGPCFTECVLKAPLTPSVKAGMLLGDEPLRGELLGDELLGDEPSGER